MTMQPSTTCKKYKNKCCKDNARNNGLEWIDVDCIEWEEYLCNDCNLSYIIPLERILSWDNAQLVESSLEDEIKTIYRYPLTKKGVK